MGICNFLDIYEIYSFYMYTYMCMYLNACPWIFLSYSRTTIATVERRVSPIAIVAAVAGTARLRDATHTTAAASPDTAASEVEEVARGRG